METQEKIEEAVEFFRHLKKTKDFDDTVIEMRATNYGNILRKNCKEDDTHRRYFFDLKDGFVTISEDGIKVVATKESFFSKLKRLFSRRK